MDDKPRPKPRTRRYEKSTNHVQINDDTRAALTCNASSRLLPDVGDILQEVKNLKQQLSTVKEERDEFKEEVTFLKYQLAYRTQVQNLQKQMSDKKGEEGKSKKTKSVRFAASVAINNRLPSEDETDDSIDGSSFDESKDEIDSSFSFEEYERLRTQTEELQDVLHDFYHDSKMAGKNGDVLIGNIDCHPSESISSLVCRVLVNYDKLCEEQRILEEEKSKLDEDKIQLTNSMAKLREQLHDAVDSNIEEIEDLNHENENLRLQVKTLGGKNAEVTSTLIKARQEYINRLKAIGDLSKGSNSEKLLQRLKNYSLLADIELKEAKELVEKIKEEKSNKVKRVLSLPATFKQDLAENSERGGLLRELKTCKSLQESQRKQISKILDEKLALETQVSELKRHIVLLKAERRVHGKRNSKLSQTDRINTSEATVNGEGSPESSTGAEVESLTRKCKDLEQKLEQVKREKQVLVREKTSLLLSFDANIEKKDALEAQLAALLEKKNVGGQPKGLDTNTAFTQTNHVVEKIEPSPSETDSGFRAGYKGISEAKVEIEKIRVQEQDKQIAILKRENETVKEKLKKAEGMSQTLQNCLKELTDEKLELLDSIEELNEEKAELEEARSKLEKELGGTGREKFVEDEKSDIRNKERKVGDNLEASKAKLAQLNLKVIEVLTLIGNQDSAKTDTKKDLDKGVEDMIGSLLLSVENLKVSIANLKTTFEKTKGDSLRTKNELEALKLEKTVLQSSVEKLTKQNQEMAESVEDNKKSQKSHELKTERVQNENARLKKELEGVRTTKTGYEKSLSESRRREEDLGRQLKNISNKRDDLQKSFDQLAKKSTETGSLLANATNEAAALRSENKKLATDLEQLREELEGTVEDRDELLELLDRIVCENGPGEEKQGLGQKVERIRERSKSDEALTDVGGNNAEKAKPVEEKLVVASKANLDHAVTGENELFDGKIDAKGVEALQEENQLLKEIVEKILNDQKKMEVVLNSLSEANAEAQQGLEESLEHTEQLRRQGLENGRGKDGVDSPPNYSPTSDENAELRRLHKAMLDTNEALSANLRRLHDEKTRSEQLKTSFQDVIQKNSTLEKNIERLTKDNESTEREILDLKKNLKDSEKRTQKMKTKKLEMENLLEENNRRVKDLKVQVDSLTEINQDLRDTNEKLSGSSKDYEKKLSQLSDEFDELEIQHEELKKAKKRLEKEFTEAGNRKTELEKELTEQGKQNTGLVAELGESKDTIISLQAELSNHAEKAGELKKSLDTSERELKLLRQTAGKVTQQEQDAQTAETLRSDMEEIKKGLSEREQRVVELENDVNRLTEKVQSSQRFAKTVSQENDALRDSLSEWEREASKIRRHVHQLSQDAENHNGESRKDSRSQEVDKVRSVKAFEAMQVELDAINKHLKSLTSENRGLTTKLDAVTKENNAARELLTRFDGLNNELEKKTTDINKHKDVKDSRSKKNNEKYEKEKNSLQSKIDKLDLENKLLKNSLGNTLDEQKRLVESLKNLIDGKNVHQRKNSGKSKKDLVSEEYEILTEISGLATTKPDLIRDSTEVKDDHMIVEQRKYKNELSVIESSASEADIKELVADLLKEQMNLKSYCHEVSKFVKNKGSKDEIDGKAVNETNLSLEATKAELEKTNALNKDLESSLEKKEAELTKVSDEKAKLESDLTTIKEKCEKLQAVFRALILLINDKKSGEKKSGEEAVGPTRIIDYVKGIKTKHATLVSEKETLESKVSDLEKEIEEHKARAQQMGKRTKDGKKRQEASENGNESEDKERILNELLLSTARNKARLLEKLREIFDEFSKVKSKLDEELDSQGNGSNLEKINEEFSESVKHTERFIQSIAHDRPVTLVADSVDEQDPNLELAKENEELIGRISALQSSRRRESKNYKDELTKMEKNKVEAVKAEETKWKDEMEKMKADFENKIKEKEQAATEVKNSLKQEVSQLKLDVRRISDEHEVAQRTARNEARVAAEKLEEKNQLLKSEMEKKLQEKDSKLVEIKRKADADAKENAQIAEREISQVRANWADAERKLRVATEEKTDTVRELDRVKQERSEEGARSSRELQKVRVALESAQKHVTEKDDSFKKERDRLQRTVASLEGQVRNAEVTGLERTQTRINELQRSLDELAKQNQQLEAARRNSEHILGTENERLKFEISRLQREVWEHNQQRRVGGVNDVQRRPDPNVPSGERVKVMGTVRQAPIEKSRKVSPVESAPGPFPGPPGPFPGPPGPNHGAPRPYPSDQQRRTVKVRENQATSVQVTRVQDQGARRSGDQRDLSANDSSGTVILARPMQARVQAQPPAQKQAPPPQKQAPPPQKQAPPQYQKPQPEWEQRHDNTWPKQKDSTRHQRYRDPSPLSQNTGSYKEDPRQVPGYPNSKPITRQTQGGIETEVTLSDARRVAEVKKHTVNGKPHSKQSNRSRRPSIGSDDVFLANNHDVNPSLTSHGSKTGEFWRSRSLEDLLVTDDRPMKQSERHVVRGHNPKLPKTFSGPRKVDPSLVSGQAVQPGRGPGNQAPGKKLAPLKGMEYVLFQSQM